MDIGEAIQLLTPIIPETTILTLFMLIIHYLNRWSRGDKIDYMELLQLLTEININKIVYGSTASAIIRCKKNSHIIYWLKKGLLKGYDSEHLTKITGGHEGELSPKLINMMLGKEKISTTTIHTAMNEVKLYLVERLDKTELYLVISTALFIFIPILTLLSLTIIKNNMLALGMIVSVGTILELINRVVRRWIKT